MQGTERYFANLQTPLMPYVFGLAFTSVNTFILVHVAVVYGIGFRARSPSGVRSHSVWCRGRCSY